MNPRQPSSPLRRLRLSPGSVVVGAVVLSATLAGLTLAGGRGWSGGVKSAEVRQEVLLNSAANAVMEPLAMAATGDDSLVVAGGATATRQAWAARLNAANKVEWIYFRESPPAERLAQEASSTTPEFRAVASMADGSVFLCGNTPYRTGASNIFLTQLDRQGQLLSEKPVETPASSGAMVYRADQCIAWGEGVVIVAHEQHYPLPGADGGHGVRASYLLLAFDRLGNFKWEQAVPTLGEGFAPDGQGVIVRNVGGALLVSATDNVDTEVLRFDAKGQLRAHRRFDGRYLLIQGQDGGALKLFGSVPDNDALPRSVITLDDTLAVVARTQGDKPFDFSVRHVFEKRDGSLLLFGSEAHAQGAGLRAGVRAVDAALKQERHVTLDHRQRLDPNAILAASARRRDGRYAYATIAVPARSAVRTSGAEPADVVVGAVVTFLE
ncbi:hypothetical protein ACFOLJ_11800 [Rugamonas sp. CCM 8940]|uniref:hypothetical protein n=1 Tax=Rugamonas sp. CCM 8940 TaxID=2765359 RepID=UPI0018F5CE66|nr:hypothetical protein [Rugamonas sp. CCM 8940]MBJ7311576.1 hypothetical protein [Rugamonas sp. CCM 8940]